MRYSSRIEWMNWHISMGILWLIRDKCQCVSGVDMPKGFFTPRLSVLWVVLAASCVGQRGVVFVNRRDGATRENSAGGFQCTLEFTSDGLGVNSFSLRPRACGHNHGSIPRWSLALAATVHKGHRTQLCWGDLRDLWPLQGNPMMARSVDRKHCRGIRLGQMKRLSPANSLSNKAETVVVVLNVRVSMQGNGDAWCCGLRSIRIRLYVFFSQADSGVLALRVRGAKNEHFYVLFRVISQSQKWIWI